MQNLQRFEKETVQQNALLAPDLTVHYLIDSIATAEVQQQRHHGIRSGRMEQRKLAVQSNVDIVLHEYMSDTHFASLRGAVVCMCCTVDNVTPEMRAPHVRGQKTSTLRVEAAGSGAVILPQFTFDETTRVKDLNKTIRHHLATEGTDWRYLDAWISLLRADGSSILNSDTDTSFDDATGSKDSPLLVADCNLSNAAVIYVVVRTRDILLASRTSNRDPFKRVRLLSFVAPTNT